MNFSNTKQNIPLVNGNFEQALQYNNQLQQYQLQYDYTQNLAKLQASQYKIDGEESAMSSNTFQSFSATLACQDISTGTSSTNMNGIEEMTNQKILHNSETILNQMTPSQNVQSMITIQEEQNAFNKQMQSIQSLNHIQLTSIRNIQDEEGHTNATYHFYHSQQKQKTESQKNRDNDFIIIPKEEAHDEVQMRDVKVNNIHTSPSFYQAKINQSNENSLKNQNLQLENTNKNQINIQQQVKFTYSQNNTDSIHVNNINIQSGSILHLNMNPFQALSNFHPSSQFIQNQKSQEQINYQKLTQKLNFNEQNEENSHTTTSPSLSSNNSNQSIPQEDIENGSSLSGYECKLKLEDGDSINFKQEAKSQDNDSLENCENDKMLKQLNLEHFEDESRVQEESDDISIERKCNFIKIITDPTQEYWNKFNEVDDEYLLSQYNKIDKNNVNKNILSSFLRYILEKGDDIVVECLDTKQKELNTIRKELKNFTRNKKLNNNTINSFFNSKRYSEQFQYYLKFYAIDYFQKSKVKDKMSHFLCIAFFLRCFYNSVLRENIVIYNKSKYFKSLNKKKYTSPKSQQLVNNPFTN